MSQFHSERRRAIFAQAILSNWIGKLLFGHILREKDERAAQLADINDATTPIEALALFQALSEQCNFWTIFSPSPGLECIPNTVWDQLKQFNVLLADLRLGAIDQGQLSRILEATVEVTVRKLRGQYPTPSTLANLLVRLCMRNPAEDRVLDPCCGSGTIARAALEQKLATRIAGEQVTAAVFAGDRDPQALQIASFALAKPDLMHMPMRIYQQDVFTLAPDTRITFQNPTDGSPFTEDLGQFDAIVSNLPFVAQDGRGQYKDALANVTAAKGFTRRADVAAYLPFALLPLLKEGGTLGVIITNAWLGTDWGDDFYTYLSKYYNLQYIITSGAGRWFHNSNVVTNMLIMVKKRANEPSNPSNSMKFVTLKHVLEELETGNGIELAAAQIELGQIQNDMLAINSVSPTTIEQFRVLGLGGNAQFVLCDWVLGLPLVPLNSLFKIRRGERRGLNALFYPAPGHGIEEEYIQPLAKSPTDFSRLCSPAAKEAFSCSRTKEDLAALGHTGALNWIRRFETPKNIDQLGTSDLQWYEMKTDALTDLVILINYGERLFVGRVTPPAFVDQRFVSLEPRGIVDIDLCHALLNSTIFMFIIEGMGFGRGLGALDLNKDRIEKYMHFLNPSSLSTQAAGKIKEAFAPLLQRNIECVADELEQPDRQAFDDAILEGFGLDTQRQDIYDALLALLSIRQTAVVR